MTFAMHCKEYRMNIIMYSSAVSIILTLISISLILFPLVEVVEAPGGDATTTLYLEATAHTLYPLGVLTSIVDTFINDGTTTEYMTQHLGTQLAEVYAKIQTTSSREYYRISPTATLDYNEAAVRPTGLIASSTSLDVHGPASTFYTVEQYRTYVDGHYAHLVSSISNVVTDPGHIQPTPIYNPAAAAAGPSARAEDSAMAELKKSLYSSYEPSQVKKFSLPTRTVGFRSYHEELELELENEIENDLFDESKYTHSGTSQKFPRQIDLDAVESDTLEVKVAPDNVKVESRPTYTVGENGELNFPTPSIEVVRPEVNIQPTEAHRFSPPKQTKSKLDSVTYVGFVDFTTTIDDTVVIFKPKNTFTTQSRNLIRPVIEPTRSFGHTATKSLPHRPALGEQFVPEIKSSNKFDDERDALVDNSIDDDDVKKHTSGVDALKSLLSASRRTKFAQFGQSTSSSSSPSKSASISASRSSRFNLFSSSVRPSLTRPSTIVSSSIYNGDSANPSVDIVPSIDPTTDVEIVFKTLFTTFTYYTTYFKESTTKIKSSEETVSQIQTITNLLKSTDLPSVSSSCAADSRCVFKSADNLEEIIEFTDGHIGRPNSKLIEKPRSGNGRLITGDEEIRPSVVGDAGELQTSYTTYTYFSTLYYDGTSTVSKHTEVYSNVRGPDGAVTSDSVPEPVISSSPATSAKEDIEPSASFPVRRLEISSVKPVQLNSELTTPSGEEEEEKPSTDRISRFRTTEQDDLEEATTTVVATTEDDGEEKVFIVTQATPALSEEVTEIVTSAAITTESNVEAEAVTEFEPKTLYTTFTYFTTLFQNGETIVQSNFETVTNVMTEPFVEPTSVEPMVTIYTTFTYWTTFSDNVDGVDITSITSREETLTDILPASVTSQLGDTNTLEETEGPKLSSVTPSGDSEGVVIQSTIAPSLAEQAQVFTYYTTKYDGDSTIVETILSTSGPVSTQVPEIQSGEPDVSIISVSTIATPTSDSTISPTSSFEDLDNDLTLSSDEGDDDEDDDEADDDEGVKPTRSRGRVSLGRPGNTFTPVIRPALRDRNKNRIFRPSKLRVSTTVATRTRTSVKPTLIATPASSAPQPTPSFGSSSRVGFLASSSLFNRGASRGFNSGSSIIGSSSISPSSVSALPTQSLTSALPVTEKPSVVIRPIGLNRPSPFRARLRERQQERLERLRNSRITLNKKERAPKEDQEAQAISIPNLPVIPGGNAPIFVSSQRQTISPNRRPKVELALDNIEVDENTARKKERARERIKALFSRKRQLFGRPAPSAAQSRRKRQVNYYAGAEFGTRTRARQSYVSGRSYPQPQSSPINPYLTTYPDQKPFTAFSQTQQQLDNYFYEDDDPYSSSNSVRSPSSPSSSRLHHPTFRRQAPSDVPDQSPSNSRSRSRESSRFEQTTSPSRSRVRTRFRDPIRTRHTTEATTTTTTKSSRFSRFRPRTTLTNPRSISDNRFSSNRNRDSLFNPRDNSRHRFGSTTSTRNSLFTRGKVVDYDDYDYYDYEDTNLQSSQNGVPDFITVTHLVPVATQIPIVEFGNTELRDILSSSPSLEVVAVTALKSTDINESPVIYANAHTLAPQPGIKDIQFDALRATETTSITFTPTRIRGRRTSFSHIVPTTIYNVETVTTRLVEPVDQNSLLNSLLQQLLLGGSPATPLKPAPVAVSQSPVTNFVTHTSTYVTTITTEDSTIIPITFRGREVTTTLVESSTQVITATEFSTETVVQTVAVPITPAPAAPLPPIAATQAPPALASPQIASLIPAILGAQQANLLSQQQEQEAALLAQQQKIQDLLQQQQEQALLAQQLAEQPAADLDLLSFADTLTDAQQEALNEQILAKINLDDFTDEELENLDLDAVVDALTGSSQSLTPNPLVFPKKNLFDTSPDPHPTEIQPESPKSSVITIFKSGSTPGDFTRVFSTIYFDDNRRRKRDTSPNDINPDKPIFVTKTELPEDSDSGLYILGGFRGPVSADIPDILTDSFIQSGLNSATETASFAHVIPTQSLQQHP